MNPRRRVLLIAMGSWAVVGLRAKTANPITGALRMGRFAGRGVKGVARLAQPIAGKPLKTAWRAALWTLKGLARFATGRKMK